MALYQPLASCAFDAQPRDGGGASPISPLPLPRISPISPLYPRHISPLGGGAPIDAALDAALQPMLARLRVPLRPSRHTHLLCTLQRAFGHLMAEVQQEIGRRQQGQP